MATDPRASPLTLALARSVGFSVEEVLAAAGLSGDRPLTFDEGMQVWKGLERLSGDPCVGLETGIRFEPDQMGPIGAAFLHSESLGDALERGGRLLDLLIGGGRIGFVERGDEAGMQQRMHDPSVRHGVDAVFAGGLNLARRATRTELVPSQIRFEAPPPPAPERYERFFGRMPRWSAEENVLLFHRHDLEREIFGASPSMATLIDEAAPSLVAGSSSRRARDFERAFWEALEEGDASVDRVARRMGLSARTLQRQLTERGGSFSTERARLLRARAEVMLKGEASIEEIAERLGYQSRRAFERAFTRWTGRSPAASRD